MEHQYPGAISGDENMLAELMLPDQAHARKEDWTIFFLHKDTNEDEQAAEEGKKEGFKPLTEGSDHEVVNTMGADTSLKKSEGEEQQDEPEGGEGPPLIYVLNLVNTKHDANAKRYVTYGLRVCHY